MANEHIGRYEVLEELGRGAMGAVYKARDPRIGRIVAVKTILTSGLDPAQLADYKRRFVREAQTAGQLSHPGIVTIHDISEDEQGEPYLVMEFIEGVTLERILRPPHRGNFPDRLPLDRALELAAQVADALGHAHRHSVVHGDVKPGNILITPEHRVRIADFGIARFTDIESTNTATILGTPAYMAPEQLRGVKVDARSDIFSLGAMIYWMITGHKPFPGEDLASVSFKVVYTDPPRPSGIDPELPIDLDKVISRCLAKDPADRYATAEEVAADLESIRQGRPILTTAAPPSRGPETTEIATLRLSTVPAPVVPAQQPLSKGLVTAAILVLTIAVMALLLRPAPQTSVVAAPASQPAQATDTQTIPKPADDVESRPALAVMDSATSQPLERMAMSSLSFECRHNFRHAMLRIYSDGEEIELALLEKKGLWLVSTGDKVESQRPTLLPAGPHQLRVQVKSRDEKRPFEKEGFIQGDFPEDGSLHLKIDFPKDAMQLHWAD